MYTVNINMNVVHINLNNVNIFGSLR